MTPDGWARVKDEFLRLSELVPDDQQNALEEIRRTDPALAAAVEELLRADREVPLLGGTDPAPAEPLPSLPGYHLLEEVGRGGMGVVYKAWQEEPRRLVALKLLSPHALLTQREIDRFHREANAIARVHHPGVVTVFAAERDANHHFFSMEFVAGRHLGRVLDQLRRSLRGESDTPSELPPFDGVGYVRAVAELGATLADALEEAHTHRIVHRDVKPSNILLTPERRVKLVDFGIARDESQGRFTQSHESPGTPDYMSPEQFQARRAAVDHRTDVYSLGAVLYEMLTLQRPYEGTSRHELPSRVLSPAPPKDVRTLNTRVPEDMQTIVAKAMAKERDKRYASAGEFRDDLRRFLDHTAIKAKREGVLERLWRLARQHRSAMGVAAILALGAASAALAAQDYKRRAAQRAIVSLTLHPGSPDVAEVFVAAYDATLNRFGTARRLGDAPLRRAALGAGAYRFTVTDGERFTEFDEFLTPGSSLIRSVALRDAPLHAESMVLIDPGGRAPEYADPRRITSPRDPPRAFLIDMFEVTNAQYLEFLEDTGYEGRPAYWSLEAYRTDPRSPSLPVVDLTYEDMQAYACWAGKRLPLVEEWMAAVQAPDNRALPWSAEGATVPADMIPTLEMLHAQRSGDDTIQTNAYFSHVRPVSASSAASRGPLQLSFMYGNVREMTATAFVHPGGVVRVVAGPMWGDHPAYTSPRQPHLAPARSKSLHQGFRCVRSVAPTHQ